MAQPVIRIPNLNVGKIVDEKGMATLEEIAFRQTLITSLQQNAGNEGLVMPSQSAANILVIQNNTLPAPSGEYTCQAGTFVYNTTNDTVMVAILVAGVPVFKTVTVT